MVESHVSADATGLKQELLARLAEANGFSLEDLEQNRNGKISDRQKQRLWSEALYPFRQAFLAAGSWVVFMFAINTIPYLGFIYRLWYRMTFGYGIAGGLMVASAIGLITGFLTSTKLTSRLLRDLSRGTVAKAEGSVWASQDRRTYTGFGELIMLSYGQKEIETIWRYALHDVRLDVSEAGARALEDRRHYRLYYTPESELLLSIEPL
jgi:hypothetical protein